MIKREVFRANGGVWIGNRLGFGFNQQQNNPNQMKGIKERQKKKWINKQLKNRIESNKPNILCEFFSSSSPNSSSFILVKFGPMEMGIRVQTFQQQILQQQKQRN